MLKQKYFLTDFFILSAEKQPIKSSWRKIEWLLKKQIAILTTSLLILNGCGYVPAIGQYLKQNGLAVVIGYEVTHAVVKQ